MAYVRVFTYAMGHSGIQHYFNNFLLILSVLIENYSAVRNREGFDKTAALIYKYYPNNREAHDYIRRFNIDTNSFNR